jgi:1-deoxy-D-xylulose 5-phosphate reductoisomerase
MYTEEQMIAITPADAIAHPKWSMGAKISVDSATMMNKGFEVIEAHWLFNIPYERIEVLVHPESVIHSMVQFQDGAIKAQLGVPDMRIPIQYALTYPYRLTTPSYAYRFGPGEALTFDLPDYERFPSLSLAIAAGQMGGNAPCVLNAANEEAILAFLAGRIKFLQIPIVVERALELVDYIEKPTLEQYIDTNREARESASWIITKLTQK